MVPQSAGEVKNHKRHIEMSVAAAIKESVPHLAGFFCL